MSDGVADFGEQWTVKTGPSINVELNIHHADALRMFRTPIDVRTSIEIYFFMTIMRLTLR